MKKFRDITTIGVAMYIIVREVIIILISYGFTFGGLEPYTWPCSNFISTCFIISTFNNYEFELVGNDIKIYDPMPSGIFYRGRRIELKPCTYEAK